MSQLKNQFSVLKPTNSKKEIHSSFGLKVKQMCVHIYFFKIWDFEAENCFFTVLTFAPILLGHQLENLDFIKIP